MRQTLSIIGVGTFGELAAKHLVPHFALSLHDKYRDIAEVANTYGATVCNLQEAAEADIILLAVPVREIGNMAVSIAPYMRKGQLVIDVASVKCKPVAELIKALPEFVDIVATHPLFGPQSGRNGIEGKNIALMNVRGERVNCVSEFLSSALRLNVIATTPEEHDRQMAYVQGLTHMMVKVYKNMNVPEISMTTKTYELLCEMVGLVKNDSDDLFRAIQTDNPFVAEVKADFFRCVKELEENLNQN